MSLKPAIPKRVKLLNKKQRKRRKQLMREVQKHIGRKATRKWLDTPNEGINGDTPLNLIRSGKTWNLEVIIYVATSGEPG